MNGFSDYRNRIADEPVGSGEWLVLDGLCRVTISRFLRDREVWAALGERWLPELAREAGASGRAAVRVWSCFATIGDHLPEPVRLKKTVGRMATYLQAYGDLMVRTNDWDPAVLDAFRSDPFVSGFDRGALDQLATTDELAHVATLIPDEWLAPAAKASWKVSAHSVV